MAKTIKRNTVKYDVMANVCVMANGSMSMLEYHIEGSATKNMVTVKKNIRDFYKQNGYKVTGIGDIVITPIYETVTYKFNITSDELFNMLIANCDYEIVENDEK